MKNMLPVNIDFDELSLETLEYYVKVFSDVYDHIIQVQRGWDTTALRANSQYMYVIFAKNYNSVSHIIYNKESDALRAALKEVLNRINNEYDKFIKC